jgi:Ca-activated chloride channel family protein
MNMDFAQPKMALLAALLTPLCGWFLFWTWRRNRDAVNLFVRARLLPDLTSGLSRRRPVVKRVMVTLGLCLVLLGLARPRWGEGEEVVQASGRDIVVCVDVSRSMLANDVAPSRLVRAKLACYDLIAHAKSDRLGLVAFAGTAFVQCPLALDAEAFRQNVAALDPDLIPEQGTSIGAALDEAAEAFSGESGAQKVVILLTDGEDHDEMALSAARTLARVGIRLFTVGVGTPNGEVLKSSDPFGNSVFLKDEDGNPVRSRLNEALLVQIAGAANGFHMPLRSGQTMKDLYSRGIAPLEATRFESSRQRTRIERFQWPLGAGLLLLLFEFLVSDAASDKRKVSASGVRQGSGTTAPPVIPAGVVTAAGMGLGLLLGLAVVPRMEAGPADEALRKYESGDFKTARSLYEDLSRKNPEDLRLRFNAGDAAYRMGDFKAAAEHYEQVLRSPDISLQQQAWYNLGNARFRLGEAEAEAEAKKEQWRQSLSSFAAAKKLDTGDAAARDNAEFVRRAIESIPPPPEQQQQRDGDSDKDDKKDEKKDQKGDANSQKRQKQKQGSEKDQGSKDREPQSQKGEGDDASDQSQPQQKEPNQAGQEPGEPKDDKESPEGKAKDGEKNGEKGNQEGSAASVGRDGQDQRGSDPAGADDGKDRRQGTMMTVREAEKVLDAQKGRERALVLRNRNGGQNGENTPARRSRKPW